MAATQNHSQMSRLEFKQAIFKNLQSSGIAENLKSQLRSKLIYQLASPLPTRQSKSIHSRIIDSLIIEYLKSSGFEFTLSVFLPESGCQSLSAADIATLLHLEHKDSLLRALGNDSMLEKICKVVSLTNSVYHKEIQTVVDVEDVIEWGLRQADKDSLEKNATSHKKDAMALEERMVRYQLDVDARMKQELEDQVFNL